MQSVDANTEPRRFYYNYKDLQVSVLLDTAVGNQIFNAGKARIWGLEASADIALDDKLKPLQAVEVTAKKADGTAVHFVTTCRIDTPVELDQFRSGGILPFVLRKLLAT